MEFKPGEKQFIGKSCGSLEKAAFVIVPVPYERTTSYCKGTEKGPAAVIEASPQGELWDEEIKREVWEDGLFTLAPVDCTGTEEEFFARLKKYVTELMNATKAVPIFIGGEHSVTQGLFAPFEGKYKNISLLHFDAHADLRASYYGDPHSHACAVRPASLDRRVVQTGIRSVGSDEKQFINSGNVKTFLMHENRDIEKLKKDVLSALTDTVYITIDVDGFDPSVMPGTGTPQPGGFSWYDAMSLFRAVCGNKKVVGADVVEVMPLPNSPITEFNAAKLIYRLMGYIDGRK